MENTKTKVYMLLLEIPNAAIKDLSNRVESFLNRFNHEDQDTAIDADGSEGIVDQIIIDPSICIIFL